MKYVIKKRENIDTSTFSRFFFGGAYRSRTDHQSFADSCLTAWLRRHKWNLFHYMRVYLKKYQK